MTYTKEEVDAKVAEARREMLQEVQGMIEGEKKDAKWFVDNYFTAENAYPSIDCEKDDRWVVITAKETHNLALSALQEKLSALIEQEK